MTQIKWTNFFANSGDKKQQYQNIVKNGYEFNHDREIILGCIALAYKIKPSEVLELDVEDIYHMISSLPGDSKLANLIYIRTEEDKEHIKNFTKAEKEERRRWNNYLQKIKAEMYSQDELEQEYRNRTTSLIDRMMKAYPSKK